MMRTTDLMNALYQRRSDLTRAQVTTIVNDVLDIIIGELAAGNDVNLFGFGRFKVSNRKGHISREVNTGKWYVVPDYRCVKFRAGRELKRRVKETRQ